MPEPADFERAQTIARFIGVWPDAEFGPAHIVLSDKNLETGHLSWCDGILYAVREERRLGGRCLFVGHSDNELEATRRLLVLLQLGQPEQQVILGSPMRVEQNRWEDVEADV